MTDASFDDLIQAKLDGTATPLESARLDTLLANDPRARERQQAVTDVFAALAARTLEVPPADLATDVMRAVRQTPEANRRAPRAGSDPGFSWFRLALPAAAACAALVLIWVAVRGPAGGESALSGSTSGAMALLDGPQQHITLALAGQTLEVLAQAGGPDLTRIELRNGALVAQVTLVADPATARIALPARSTAGHAVNTPDGSGIRFELAAGGHAEAICQTKRPGGTVLVVLIGADGARTEQRLDLASAKRR